MQIAFKMKRCFYYVTSEFIKEKCKLIANEAAN